MQGVLSAVVACCCCCFAPVVIVFPFAAAVGVADAVARSSFTSFGFGLDGFSFLAFTAAKTLARYATPRLH